MIKRIVQHQHIPVIAGGLIDDKEDIMTALKAGATAISTTETGVVVYLGLTEPYGIYYIKNKKISRTAKKTRTEI